MGDSRYITGTIIQPEEVWVRNCRTHKAETSKWSLTSLIDFQTPEFQYKSAETYLTLSTTVSNCSAALQWSRCIHCGQRPPEQLPDPGLRHESELVISILYKISIICETQYSTLGRIQPKSWTMTTNSVKSSNPPTSWQWQSQLLY
jgi:hypothetical protein